MKRFLMMIAGGALIGVTGLGFAAYAGGDRDGYVCGVKGPEDLVAIPHTRWIVTSGLQQEDQPGRLFLVDRKKKKVDMLFPSVDMKVDYQPDDFPGCPGPVDSHSFSAHGINLKTGADGVSTLYVINHGEREAVEVFRLEPDGVSPSLTWTGCVLLPDGAMGNGVAPLPGGGIAVTLFLVPEYFAESTGEGEGEMAWIAKLRNGQPTGYAAQWREGEGWRKIAGTEASGPNGIEVSADGLWAWVANWGDKTINLVPLENGNSGERLELDFMPDNLRWGDDGSLWVAGATGSPDYFFDCWATPGCKNDYAIAKIHPTTLAVTAVPHPNTLPEFGEATTALKVDNEIWLGANPSSCVAYFGLEQ